MPETAQLTNIGLVMLLFLVILAGLALVGGLTVSSIAADTTTADSGSGQTLVVDDDTVLLASSADCPDAEYVTIQNAIDAAEPGDTVEVCEGTYSESVTVETDDVSIRANGSVEVEPGVPAAFDIAADNVTVDGVTVTKTEGLGIQVTGDRAVIENNHVHSTKKHENTAMDTGIRLRITNETVVRNNTVVGFPDHGISVAEADEPDTWTNDATDNRIEDNHVTGETDTEFVNSGIYVGSRAGGTEVLNNTITDIYWNPAGQYSSYTGEGGRPQYGIGIWVNGTQTEVRGNTMRRSFWGITSDTLALSMVNNTMTNITFHGGQLSGDEHEAVVRNNTLDGALTGGFQGILNGGSIVMAGNTVRNVECGAGYAGGGCGTGLDVTINDANSTARFLDNRVKNNTIGIRIVESQSEFEDHDRLDTVEIHGNVIVQNDVLGISNSNRDSTDGYWPILDARNNIWDCGGPSGDLEDPYTGRVANGTGDGLSAGDETGVSNVHFDPYQVQNPSTCTESQPPPTDTPTATPTDTPTATPTDTPTATPTPTPTPPSAGEDGDGDGTESGDGGGDDTAFPSGESTDGSDGATVTPPPSPTATPSATPPPTATSTLTPVVEPGFGVLTGVVGVVTLLGIVAIRRWRTVGGIDGRD